VIDRYANAALRRDNGGLDQGAFRSLHELPQLLTVGARRLACR